MRTALGATLAALAACGHAAGPAPAPTPAPTAATTAEAPQAPAPDHPGDQEVTLTTLDGVSIVGTYVPGPAGSDRAVVFLHQLSSTRAEWAPFVDALRGAYHLLAIDMRGHGGSTRGTRGALDWHDFDQAAWEAVENDLAAASQFLSERGVALGGTVVIGSSIGSTAALRYAGDHPDLGGLVLLSPGLKYRGVETVPAARRYGKPKLLVYSSDAEDAARVLEATWSKEPTLAQPQPVVMHAVPGKAHGVKMLADDPGLVDAVAAFIAQTLGAR